MGNTLYNKRAHTICMAPTKKNYTFCMELTIFKRMLKHRELAA